MPIRIVIIEDNASFASTFERYFNRPGSEVRCVAVYPSAEVALQQLPEAAPDVAMVDINLPGMNGIECIAQLKQRCPEVLCLVLTTFEEDTHIFDALKAGASGYLLKRSSPDQLTEAIKQVLSGGAPMSPQIARQVVSFFYARPPRQNVSGLSPREKEIIELLATGLTYKQIAPQLEITFETVRSYMKKIYEKLHAHSRTDAVNKYREQA